MRRGVAALTFIVVVLPLGCPGSARAASVGASGLVAVPGAQSVTKGGTVSLTVQVAGAPSGAQVSYVVLGRNDGVHGTVTTGSDGSATLSYRDHGTSASASSDTIALIDAAQDESATATVDYLDGPDVANTVTLDTSGLGVDDESCDQGAASADQIPIARETMICAALNNALGEPLAGKTVTFAVSTGTVGPAGDADPAPATTYLALTDRAGVAFAEVTSTAPGAQQILATADRLRGGSTLTYAAPVPSDAAKVSITPASATVGAGRRLRATAVVTDAYGNAVAGAPITVDLAGPGNLASPALGAAKTTSDGQVRLVVATDLDDRGPGSLTVALPASTALCAMTKSCSATASYAVTKPVVPASVTLVAAPGARTGAIELVAAVVKGSDGSVEVGQVVHFRVSGADTAVGAVRTNRKGIALFGYPAQRVGSDLVRAWDDVSRDGRHQRLEPAGSLRVVIAEK